MTDPLAFVALWLARHVEWIRHRQEAEEFLADVEKCVRIITGVARGPAAQRYLGPCGARVERIADESGVTLTEECDGDVYAHDGAERGTCRECGATVGVGERRAWLDETVRGYAFRASQIAGAFGINVNTIRSWAMRGHLVAHGRDEQGRPLYNVGEVRDRAVTEAVRRAENQARRARRREDAA